MRHVTLIKPRIGHRGMERYIDAGRMEPLQMGAVAALVPPNIDLTFWDDRVDNIDFEKPTDAVFITIETFTARRGYEIAAEYRRRGIPTVLGGMHAALATVEVAAEADSVYIGDAEFAFQDILDDLAGGRLKKFYEAPRGFPPSVPRPRRDIFRRKGYLPFSLLQRGRGCVNHCTFCATSAYFGSRHHVRADEEVLEEIRRDCGPRLFFVDDNFTADRDGVKEFLRQLIPLKRLWVTQMTVDAADDPELLDLLQRSGCMGGVIGFESLDPDNLAGMGKSGNLKSFSRYRDQIAAFRRHDFNIWAAFTLGHDHDTAAGLRETLDFALDNAFAFAAFNILTPYPGTPLYDELAAEGRLLFDGKWWLHPDYSFNDAVFTPARMSAAELTKMCWDIRFAFNSARSVWRRLRRFRLPAWNLLMGASYLAYCRIFHKEIVAKRRLVLGIAAAATAATATPVEKNKDLNR